MDTRRKEARRLAGVLASAAVIVAGALATAAPAQADDGDGDRVFATREGLVGKTTANGHEVAKSDHFVALPSTRALSADGTGTYTVRVCAPATDRCEYSPVWDVGPWNTNDDYWSSTRHGAPDLPRGLPQAQAAYQDGHRGGKDMFDRTVTNPAGIDLADGTFAGLGLTDNAWVDVSFLWQHEGPTGVVRTEGGTLNVRSGPSTDSASVGVAVPSAVVVVECTTRGQQVDGHLGSTDLWNRIGPGQYISDAYLRTGTGDPVAAAC
ncbi:MAG: hypothetical protein ACRDXB_16870 [Actinomycetes bacterium]